MSTGRWTRGITRVAVLLWGAWLATVLVQVVADWGDPTWTLELVGKLVLFYFIVPGLLVLGIRWAVSGFEKGDKP